MTVNLSNAYGGLSGVMPLLTGALQQTFSASQFTVGSAPDPASHYSFVCPGATVEVVAPYQLTWTGNAGSTWDTANTANFSDANNTGPGTFNSLTVANALNVPANPNALDHVTFDDSGSGGTVAIAAAGVTPESVTFNNSSKSYTLTGGAIMGPAELILSGGGSLVLDNTNSFSGGVTVENGTLIAATPGAIPAGAVLTVGAGGVFDFDPSLAGSSMTGGQAYTASRVEAVAAVPEPGTFALLAAGGIFLAFRAWRRRR